MSKAPKEVIEVPKEQWDRNCRQARLLARALDRIRKIHVPMVHDKDTTICSECIDPYPCATMQAFKEEQS